MLLLAINSQAFFVPDTGFEVRSKLDIIKAYLQARQKSMQEDANKEDVERLLDFYADTLYYEHILSPQKKFVFHGKDDLRNGYLSHLGKTRNVKITLIKYIEKHNMLMAEYSTIREIILTGKRETYTTVSLYELDNSGKITHEIDYL